MNKWEVIHRYRRAVVRGMALPIRCPDCHDELVQVFGIGGEPVFKCFDCRATYDLGADVWKQIKAIADEYAPTIAEYYEGL